MPAAEAEDLFISEQHPVSQRWAILEDNGRVAWLYLTEAGSQKPAADCWLYNRVAIPPRFDSARGEAPVVPATHAASGAAQNPPIEKSAFRLVARRRIGGSAVRVGIGGFHSQWTKARI
jgi:hypothetical protein